MSVGAVMFRTGTSKASELGGLYRTMPRTATFCLIGAASISAFPLFSGFVTKSLILDATAAEHYPRDLGGTGVCQRRVSSATRASKSRIFTFFAHDSGIASRKRHRRTCSWAMGITAFLCIAIGIYPEPLVCAPALSEVEFHPYTTNHVVAQLQLLLFALLAFGVLMRTGMHPPEIRAVNLDTDWTYRKAAPSVIGLAARGVAGVWNAVTGKVTRVVDATVARLYRSHGPEGRMAAAWPTGAMVLWLGILLGVTLIVSFFS